MDGWVAGSSCFHGANGFLNFFTIASRMRARDNVGPRRQAHARARAKDCLQVNIGISPRFRPNHQTSKHVFRIWEREYCRGPCCPYRCKEQCSLANEAFEEVPEFEHGAWSTRSSIERRFRQSQKGIDISFSVSLSINVLY